MKQYKLLFLVCVTSLLFASCRESHSTHIKIVCTGDVHGHLFPTDFLTAPCSSPVILGWASGW